MFQDEVPALDIAVFAETLDERLKCARAFGL